ncbi:MAG: hypothetical protein RL318_1100 [Fibrobacterota bacterium]
MNAQVVKLVDALDSKSNGGDSVTVRFRPWVLGLVLAFGPASQVHSATDGVRYLDLWKSLGVSMQDVPLIDKYDIDKDVVERLVNAGVSIREYLKKPWLEMGLSEDDWFEVLEKGSDIALLETMYDREDATLAARPNLFTAFLLPGYHQIKEDRTVSGGVMAGSAVLFAALTFLDRDEHTGGGMKFTWPVLWGVTSMVSAGDIWARHYREQAVTGFTLEWRPGGSAGLSWRRSL